MALRPQALVTLLLFWPTSCAVIADLPEGRLAPEDGSVTAGTSGAGAVGGSSGSGAIGGAGGSAGSAGSPVDGGSAYAAAVLADEPVAYWRLGETSGNTAFDSSPNARHGSYQGGALLAQPGAIANDPDGAVRFDASSLMDAGDIFGFEGSAAFTLEAWIRPDISQEMIIGGKLHWDEIASAHEGYLLDLDMQAGGVLKAWRMPSGGFVQGGSVTLGTFSHVVLTYDGVLSIYQNGQKLAGNPASGSIPLHSATFRIADGENWVNFTGVIDEFAVYDRALEANRILLHYEIGSGTR